MGPDQDFWKVQILKFPRERNSREKSEAPAQHHISEAGARPQIWLTPRAQPARPLLLPLPVRWDHQAVLKGLIGRVQAASPSPSCSGFSPPPVCQASKTDASQRLEGVSKPPNFALDSNTPSVRKVSLLLKQNQTHCRHRGPSTGSPAFLLT